MASTAYSSSSWQRWRFRMISILIVLAGAFFLPQFYLAERIIWHRGQSRSLHDKPKSSRWWRWIPNFNGLFMLWANATIFGYTVYYAKIGDLSTAFPVGICFILLLLATFIMLHDNMIQFSRSRLQQKPEVVGSVVGGDDEGRGSLRKNRAVRDDEHLQYEPPPPIDYSALKKALEVD